MEVVEKELGRFQTKAEAKFVKYQIEIERKANVDEINDLDAKFMD